MVAMPKPQDFEHFSPGWSWLLMSKVSTSYGTPQKHLRQDRKTRLGSKVVVLFERQIIPANYRNLLRFSVALTDIRRH